MIVQTVNAGMQERIQHVMLHCNIYSPARDQMIDTIETIYIKHNTNIRVYIKYPDPTQPCIPNPKPGGKY